jgi:hypothetical protein
VTIEVPPFEGSFANDSVSCPVAGRGRDFPPVDIGAAFVENLRRLIYMGARGGKTKERENYQDQYTLNKTP